MFERFWRKPQVSETRLKPALSLSPRAVTVAELRQLIPLRNFSEEELSAFALTQTTETYGPGSILFERGESESCVLYLLTGTVRMALNDQQSYEVIAGTAKARFPLSYGESHRATAIAITDVEVIRVSAQVMHKNLSAQLKEDRVLDPSRWEVPLELKSSRLLQAFCQNFQNEELALPTLPDVALRLRQAIARDGIGVAEAAKIVQADPSIAAKLLHVANSPLYLCAQPAKSCLEAVSRLGLKATCSLVVSFCLSGLFKSKDEFLGRRMRALWQEAIHVSALAYVLAKDNRWPNPEEALLAGLVCDIGQIPLLAFADGFPKDQYRPQEIEPVCLVVCGPIGYYLLKRWSFPEELANVPLLSTLWHYDSGPTLTVSDIVMLARLHRYLETGRIAEVPAINAIPACGKLRDGTLSPEYSLKVLHEAKAQVQEALSLLR